ncbi:RHS repeat-associated core domain-containing protein, partial [Escherichia sp. 93.0816]|uniref:RHS repeat-associated core domain-containing protein n=1 Tax=Escherichia sp. 93.0816 TaxID=2723308 RepID=UPI0025701685
YNLHRYYDPDVGRFTQPDLIGLAGGLNLYSYAPNPLGWIDPLGLTTTPIYENPGHHDPNYLPNRQVPFNSTKSVIPPNAETLFGYSQVDPNDPKTRWTKVGEGKKAVWHRFQSSAGDGSKPFHWNGSTDGVDIKGRARAIDIKNVPRAARNMKGCEL